MDQAARALYVIGGRQKNRTLNEWHAYEKATILRVEPGTCKITRPVEYVSPREVCPDNDPSILFKAASLEGNRLYVCTNTEVLVFEVPGFRQVGHLSASCFNDVHHVRPAADGNVFVVSTGLDIVLEMSPKGHIVQQWATIGGEPWLRFSRDIDYRKVETTKPHISHPNFVFRVNGNLWVTRFKQRDAICLDKPDQRLDFCGAPHDGVVTGGRIYFTTVNGFVYIVDHQTMSIVECIDLNEIDNRNVALGWARGIWPVDDRRCWVGFSRLRPTKLKDNLSWAKHGFKQYFLPTRIALYDLVEKALLREINTESHGIHAIYSILTEPA